MRRGITTIVQCLVVAALLTAIPAGGTGGGNASFTTAQNFVTSVSAPYDYIPISTPATLSLFGSGLVFLGVLQRRKMKTSKERSAE